MPPAERRSSADHFAAACAAVTRRLPWGLPRLIPANLLGFGLVNGFTFGIDLALVGLLYRHLGWPIWLAVSVGYLSASALSFVLNRWLNFRSHAPVGQQVGWYVAVIAMNYLVIVLGVGAGLTSMGVQYQLSRILAAGCEAVFLYCALRWVVFNST